MVIGVENLAALSFDEYFTYQLLPSSILAIFIYALMARLDSVKAWIYATIVFIFNSILGFLIISLLMQELYISPTWFVELPLSVFSAIAGTLIGVNWGEKRATAT